MTSIFGLLEREWARLATDACWGVELADVCEDVGALDLAELQRWVRSAPDGDADRVLVPLAARAAGGSEVAARVLVQLLLPGIRRLSSTWWVLGDHDERAAAALAAAYRRIRHYPIERRPGRVAANVLRDAGHDLWRAARRARQEADWLVVVDPHALPAGQADRCPNAAAELADALNDAVAAGYLGREEAQLIAATRIAGRRMADVAAERGATLRTLQRHRRAAELALIRAGAAA